MKRIAIGLAIGLSFVIANISYGATQGSSTSTVDATIVPTLVMSLTGASYDMGALPIGTTEKDNAQGVSVQSNVDYNIKAKSDKATMQEYVTAAAAYATDTTRTLQYPIKAKETAQAVLTSIGTTEAVIQGCADLEHTGNAATVTYIDYSQEINYADEALPSGRTHHCLLTFSVYQNALE
ncbi:MAG: hypothetical protein AB1414_08805 [bacterium]